MSSDDLPFFPEDYVTARTRFRDSAQAAGARLHELVIDERGPDGETLSIDIAWLGSRDPSQVFIHSCGLHGVEGFAGSAIQAALLQEPWSVTGNGACLYVHALNPFGMAWLRRVNEHNVDLNRNCYFFADAWSGAPEAYKRLDPFLNPSTPPRLDHFYLQAVYLIGRYGLKFLKQAIAGGQYEYPQGLFFGGKALEQEPALYRAWLVENLRAVRQVLAIDVHTGLGKWGQDSIFLDGMTDNIHDLNTSLGKVVICDKDEDALGYTVSGGYAGIFESLQHHPTVQVLTQEFGTYWPIGVLHALREENRLWHYANPRLAHPVKQRLKETFAPRSATWRARVVDRGVSLAKAARTYVFSNPTIVPAIG